VLALTNSSGAVVERYSYDAYGTPSIWDDSLGRFRSMGDSAVGNTLLYTGRPYDRIVGLYDMRARQYSPSLGRFTSRDPIGFEGGINLYAYTGNSPLNYTDRF
jgi:RHS repeat-associated protein